MVFLPLSYFVAFIELLKLFVSVSPTRLNAARTENVNENRSSIAGTLVHSLLYHVPCLGHSKHSVFEQIHLCLCV